MMSFLTSYLVPRISAEGGVVPIGVEVFGKRFGGDQNKSRREK